MKCPMCGNTEKDKKKLKMYGLTCRFCGYKMTIVKGGKTGSERIEDDNLGNLD